MDETSVAVLPLDDFHLTVVTLRQLLLAFVSDASVSLDVLQTQSPRVEALARFKFKLAAGLRRALDLGWGHSTGWPS